MRHQPLVVIQDLDRRGNLLQSLGRSLVQGALGWLWGKSDQNIPVPGARSVAQIEGIAEALTFGPLSPSVVSEIDNLMGGSDFAAEDRPR